MDMIKVLVADDHPLVREGLARLLGDEEDIQVVAQAADDEEGVRLAAELVRDVAVGVQASSSSLYLPWLRPQQPMGVGVTQLRTRTGLLRHPYQSKPSSKLSPILLTSHPFAFVGERCLRT